MPEDRNKMLYYQAPTPITTRALNINRFRIQITLSLTAAILYIAGKSIFAVWDTNNQAMGARYWAETGAAWMGVWPGLDLFIGALTRLTNDTDLAITISGASLNALATILIYQSCLSLDLKKSSALIAGAATSLWFLPHQGGWVGDNASYLIGSLPMFACITFQKKNLNVYFLTLGACAAIGLTVKLNSFIPAFITGVLFSCAIRWQSRHDKFKAHRRTQYLILTAASFLLFALSANTLIGSDDGIYRTILDSYQEVKNSNVVNQISSHRYYLLPLGVDFIKAVRDKSFGVLIFSPLAGIFWIATIWSISQTRSADKESRIKHLFALFLLFSSALVCVGLGRGLTHRLFLIPAGTIVSLDDLFRSPNKSRILASSILFYLAMVWISFAYIQRAANISKIYDTRKIFGGSRKEFCLAASKAIADNQAGDDRIIGVAYPDVQIDNDFTCWKNYNVKAVFSGTGDVQEIGNGLDIVFSNQLPLKWVLREKWFNTQASPAGRKAWVQQEISAIERLESPFYFEKIGLTESEAASADYGRSWQRDREIQVGQIANELGAHPIGKIGDITIWKTKWYTKKTILGSTQSNE